MVKKTLQVVGVVALLVLLVLWANLWLPARKECVQGCKLRGSEFSSVVGWFTPTKCLCKGNEFPLWERTKP